MAMGDLALKVSPRTEDSCNGWCINGCCVTYKFDRPLDLEPNQFRADTGELVSRKVSRNTPTRALVEQHTRAVAGTVLSYANPDLGAQDRYHPHIVQIAARYNGIHFDPRHVNGFRKKDMLTNGKVSKLHRTVSKTLPHLWQPASHLHEKIRNSSGFGSHLKTWCCKVVEKLVQNGVVQEGVAALTKKELASLKKAGFTPAELNTLRQVNEVTTDHLVKLLHATKYLGRKSEVAEHKADLDNVLDEDSRNDLDSALGVHGHDAVNVTAGQTMAGFTNAIVGHYDDDGGGGDWDDLFH